MITISCVIQMIGIDSNWLTLFIPSDTPVTSKGVHHRVQ